MDKKSFLLTGICSLFLLLCACSKDEGGDDPGGNGGTTASLSIQPNVTAVQFSADGNTATVTASQTGSPTAIGTVLATDGVLKMTISHNQSSWDVTQPSGSWVHVTKSGQSFTVTVDPNQSTNSKEPVKLTITAGSAPQLTLDILQSGTAPSLSVLPLATHIQFTADGRTATVVSVPEGSPVSPGDVLADEFQLKMVIDTNQPTWSYTKTPSDATGEWLRIQHTLDKEITLSVEPNLIEKAPEQVKLTFTAEATPSVSVVFSQLPAELQLPEVRTLEAGEITGSSIVLGGHIVHTGNPAYIERGVCWSRTAEPVTSDFKKVVEGTGTGEFTITVTDLSFETTYYVRAYATNENGTAYGAQISFSIPAPPRLPVVSTSEALNIIHNAATLGGAIVNGGNPDYTERGVCWSTTPGPTTADNKQNIAKSDLSLFSATVQGLTPNTTYYVRAWAVNTTGTAYGEEIVFTTTPTPVPPELYTLSATSITRTSAVLGGQITNAGIPAYTQRGICWSTSEYPSISNQYVIIAGSGTGKYTYTLSGLNPEVSYYIRAFAINRDGVVYGQQVFFMTLSPDPSQIRLSGQLTSENSLELTWTYNWPTPGGATDHYELEYAYDNVSYSALIIYRYGDKRSPLTEPISLSAEDQDKTIYFRVRAFVNGLYTPYSNVISIYIPKT